MILPKQTLVLLVCNIVIFILIVSNMFLGKNKNWFLSIVLLIALIVPIMLMQLYSVNCMVTGDCNSWSWFLVAVAVLCTLVYIIGFINSIINLKKNTGPTIKTEEENLRLKVREIF